MKSHDIYVTKRNGGKEPLDIEKIHKVLYWATENINSVSVSEIEIHSKLQFYNGITSEEIHNILIRSASDLISIEQPNYQFVASRLLLFHLRKSIYGDFQPNDLYSIIEKGILNNIYTDEILKFYTKDEIDIIDKTIVNHERDFLFTYAGLRQLTDKYLIQNRKTKTLYETPQIMYVLISMILFHKYGENRLQYVKKYYDAISTFKINLPTPIMSGLRSKLKQFASCVVFDVGDSMDSILATAHAVGLYATKRSGIGLNFSRIRAKGSSIRDGEVLTTGVIPFLKIYQSVMLSTSQNGIRGASGTVYFPYWHKEIDDIIRLKDNTGTEDNRVRHLDYAICLDKTFYDKVRNNEDITLLCPNENTDLYEVFGTPEFEIKYREFELKNKKSEKINARKLLTDILVQRLQTGRLYIFNIDHANSHSSYNDVIHQSNLCLEVCAPTSPIKSIDDLNGEVATCILAALNVGEIKDNEFEEICDLIVRGHDELIDYQEYPIPAANQSTLNRRSLGVGITNFAYYLAKNKCKWSDKEALELTHDLAEKVQYYLLKASNNLAKAKGTCVWYGKTKYSNGLLPIDTYEKKLDKIYPNKLKLDWKLLRQDIKNYGLRHSALTAAMPAESSSVVQNSTNGLEPIRDLLVVKNSKAGILKQIVKGFSKYKNYYTLAFDVNNKDYLNLIAIFQKFFDQSISTNLYYDYEKFENSKLPLSKMFEDIIYAYSIGVKSIYYNNTNDGNKQTFTEDKVAQKNKVETNIETDSCESGACSI